MNRAVVHVTTGLLLAGLREVGFDLPADVTLVAHRYDPFLDRVELLLDGSGLPEQGEGCVPQIINPRSQASTPKPASCVACDNNGRFGGCIVCGRTAFA